MTTLTTCSSNFLLRSLKLKRPTIITTTPITPISFCTIQQRYSSAFDPDNYLHFENVRNEQSKTFYEVWTTNKNDVKQYLTEKEIAIMDKKVQKTMTLDEFEDKLKGLWGPKRHHFVRQTNTWKYVNECVNKWLQANHPSSLVFGTDEEFVVFQKTYLKDPESLLKDFTLADLRYMCALMAIDYTGGPKLTAVFGCRKRYHYSFPDPLLHSAHWLDCVYDKCTLEERVLLTCVNAIKEDKPISLQYFREKLESMKHNALKDIEWSSICEKFIKLKTEEFNDKFDRVFVGYQTDKGVTQLQTRFDTDIF